MMLDVLGRIVFEDTTRLSPHTPVAVWMKRQASPAFLAVLAGLLAMCLLSFWLFAPFTYGTGFSSVKILTSRRWLPAWDFQYATPITG
jgi:dolichyl-phosphate-mannose--protein O-mannosyl transferase